MSKICFTTSANEAFIEGMKGLVASIRKFYKPDEADIVVFFEEPSDYVAAFCRSQSAQLHSFDKIDSWRRPLMQSEALLADASHFYHQDFQPLPGMPHHLNRENLDVDRVHHLHPLNVKAHSTAYCACVLNAPWIVHIDSDAFLLSRVDDIFRRHHLSDTIIGFEDGPEDLAHAEQLFGLSQNADFDPNHYGFNAGIVFYVNGPGLQRLMIEFSFFIDSCYHYTYRGPLGDQGILRALVAKHDTLGTIRFVKEEATNWNPTWFRADDLLLDRERNVWINAANGREQHIWHGAGGAKVWTGQYGAKGVNEAWVWVGGKYEPGSYESVGGSLIKPHCQLICHAIVEHFQSSRKKDLQILDLGTQYGRTAIALCLILQSHGFVCQVDSFDIYAPSPGYPDDFSTLAEAEENVLRFHLEDRITLHTVESCEDIAPYLKRAPDVVFIDADHRYKHVVADCIVARSVLAPGGIILGDDYQMQSVRKAVWDAFGQDKVTALNHSLWSHSFLRVN